jgi:hypothetical protein
MHTTPGYSVAPNTEVARATVRDMHNRGLITTDERIAAMREIAAGRGVAAVAHLRRQVSA